MTAVLEPDVQKIAYDVLSAALTARIVGDTPANLADVLPVLRVFRIGGPGDTYGVFDDATIAMHGFATDQQGANLLCRQAMQALFNARGNTYANGAVMRVRKLSGPTWAPYDNQGVRHAVTLVQLTVKPVS